MKETKKIGNKGFSLVELIVVIAIMAVFVGVLSPQYMKWVERARLQKDNSAIGEIAQAMKLAYSDEALRDRIGTNVTITLSNSSDTDNAKYTGFDADTATTLQKEVAQTAGATFETSSKAYKESDEDIVLTLDSNGNVSAVGYIEVPGDNPTTSANAKKF